ncbi:BCCT family transporter [Marinobacterium rhizophilum]|uniref:BCCT family transporter n=1 Tax=Marinobacterium rhizophilum TaxID=420402 RepID=A0ABY5HKQ2_9GAMM|nr:BCCT family transporter [Marinobacterium rhizophilum]UTW12699.1 BCCT family transporter [Marinobacterium rhizophilum]
MSKSDPDNAVDKEMDFSTDHEMGQDNIRPFGLDIHNPVFAISSLMIIAFVLLALANQEDSATFFGWLRPWLTSTFDWFLVLSVNAITLFCLALIVLPVGSVRIGGKDARPDYSYPGWISMMFAAGIGIGLLFFGVLEPVYYNFAESGGARPLGIDATAPGNEYIGVVGTIHHWGLEAWAVYAAVGLSLAIFSYNLGLPLTLRSAFYPILGERVWGWWGHAIDTLAVFATLFGLTTSLGLGAQQVAAGLNEIFGIEPTGTVTVLIIIGITAIALCSVLLGMDKGVKRLSEINMIMAVVMFIFVLLVTGLVDGVTRYVSVMADYIVALPALSNPFGRDDTSFFHGWTTFYWAWWIAWSPFVGMFIARISRGRTVREFILCALIAPTAVCALWMSTFGGAAIDMIIAGGAEGVVATVVDSYKPEGALFGFLRELPFYGVVAPLALVLIVIFFVTSSDSGSLVIDTITAGGKMDAPVVQRVFWCTLEGLVAIALLLGGGLSALQGAAVSTGIPFTLVVLTMCYCLWLALKSERAKF